MQGKARHLVKPRQGKSRHLGKATRQGKARHLALLSYLIKGLALPLVGIKYPTISTNLLKHSDTRKGN
jgi:hypothetical protein